MSHSKLNDHPLRKIVKCMQYGYRHRGCIGRGYVVRVDLECGHQFKLPLSRAPERRMRCPMCDPQEKIERECE